MKFATTVNGHPGPDPAEFHQLTNEMQIMLWWVDRYMQAAYCQEAEITSMIRPGEDSAHGHGRAADIRTNRRLSRVQARELESAIRKRFGPAFLDPLGTGKWLWRAWYHDSGRGWHLHIASPT